MTGSGKIGQVVLFQLVPYFPSQVVFRGSVVGFEVGGGGIPADGEGEGRVGGNGFERVGDVGATPTPQPDAGDRQQRVA